MGVEIHETGRHYQSRGIDYLAALMGLKTADLGDAAVLNPEVAAEAGKPGSVDDRSIHDHAVEFRHRTTSYGSKFTTTGLVQHHPKVPVPVVFSKPRQRKRLAGDVAAAAVDCARLAA